jgi:transposase
MTDQRRGLVAGVDAHTDEHHLAVLDMQGRLLGAAAFPTSAQGYAELIAWAKTQGEIDRVGVESSAAYAAGLVRALLAEGSGSSRSTSPIRTRGSGWARAIRSTPNLPPARH